MKNFILAKKGATENDKPTLSRSVNGFRARIDTKLDRETPPPTGIDNYSYYFHDKSEVAHDSATEIVEMTFQRIGGDWIWKGKKRDKTPEELAAEEPDPLTTWWESLETEERVAIYSHAPNAILAWEREETEVMVSLILANNAPELADLKLAVQAIINN